jgi:uncharacterized protein (TIGR03086 family)
MAVSTDVSAAYARAIEQAQRIVGGIQPDQWESRTPCREWNTRELLNHLVGSNLMMATVGGGGSMGDATSGTDAVAALGDLLGEDPAGAYARASAAAQRAFAAPGALERTWRLPFAELPGAVALDIHLLETLSHTWDIASTTGQLGGLDPELAEISLAFARRFLLPEHRNPKGDPFAAEVAVPRDAGAYDRFVGFLGRTP